VRTEVLGEKLVPTPPSMVRGLDLPA